MVDVKGLIASGYLDFDAIFRDADWRRSGTIATYTALFMYRDEEIIPHTVEVVLESAIRHGIVAYRWHDAHPFGVGNAGPISLDQSEVIASGQAHAKDFDQSAEI